MLPAPADIKLMTGTRSNANFSLPQYLAAPDVDQKTPHYPQELRSSFRRSARKEDQAPGYPSIRSGFSLSSIIDLVSAASYDLRGDMSFEMIAHWAIKSYVITYQSICFLCLFERP